MRHQKSGRRLNRDTDARKALMRNLCSSLLEHGRITTTEAKAKEVAPQYERHGTYAKKGTLAGARALRRELLTENATQKMLQELLPAFEGRQGGYTRIIKLGLRRGDSAPMAQLSLVLNDVPKAATKPAAKAKAKTPAKTKAAQTEAKTPELAATAEAAK
jgi:large subunit ribosomal protein L17